MADISPLTFGCPRCSEPISIPVTAKMGATTRDDNGRPIVPVFLSPGQVDHVCADLRERVAV